MLIKRPKVNNNAKRAEAYKEKVSKRFDNNITVFNYISSKEKFTAQCNKCNYVWKKRNYHLLARFYCPSCRKWSLNGFPNKTFSSALIMPLSMDLMNNRERDRQRSIFLFSVAFTL